MDRKRVSCDPVFQQTLLVGRTCICRYHSPPCSPSRKSPRESRRFARGWHRSSSPQRSRRKAGLCRGSTNSGPIREGKAHWLRTGCADYFIPRAGRISRGQILPSSAGPRSRWSTETQLSRFSARRSGSPEAPLKNRKARSACCQNQGILLNDRGHLFLILSAGTSWPPCATRKATRSMASSTEARTTYTSR